MGAAATAGGGFELAGAPARLDAVVNVTGSKKSDSDEGTLAKRVTFLINVTEKKHWKRVVELFEGAFDDGTPQKIAAGAGHSTGHFTKRQFGPMLTKIYDADGTLKCEVVSQKTSPMHLSFEKEARSATLKVTTVLPVPKKNRAVFDDYFKADVLIDLSAQQLEMKLPTKKDEEAADQAELEKKQVDWTKRKKK